MRTAHLALISGRQMHRINACIFLVAITKNGCPTWYTTNVRQPFLLSIHKTDKRSHIAHFTVLFFIVLFGFHIYTAYLHTIFTILPGT